MQRLPTTDLMFEPKRFFTKWEGFRHTTWTIDKPLISAVIMDYGWDGEFFHASGAAKCSPEDAFDEEFGMYLAVSRATQRLERKIQKALIRSLDKKA